MFVEEKSNLDFFYAVLSSNLQHFSDHCGFETGTNNFLVYQQTERYHNIKGPPAFIYPSARTVSLTRGRTQRSAIFSCSAIVVSNK